MNIYKIKKLFLASILFKIENKETTQNVGWVCKLWAFILWDTQLNELRLSKDKDMERISQSIVFKRQCQNGMVCI